MTDSYVYALVDPRDDEIRYIGITSRAVPAVRFNDHVRESTKNTRTRKRAWIRSLLSEGLLPTFAVIECGEMNKLELAVLEIAYIAEYTLAGHDLTNITEGGDGIAGYAAPRTSEWRANLSVATRKHYESLSHQERSDRSLKRLATILANNNGVYPGYSKGTPSHWRGKTLPEETKQKMREAHLRRWERIRSEGNYEEVCANIASGTREAMKDPEIREKCRNNKPKVKS